MSLMSRAEVWTQKSLSGEGNKERENYFLIPKGIVVWPQKDGRVIDRYRGALTKAVLTTPIFIEAEKVKPKTQRRKQGLLLWNLLGTSRELPDGSLAIEEGATLYLNGRYWQIKSGSIIGTGSKKENNIKRA